MLEKDPVVYITIHFKLSFIFSLSMLSVSLRLCSHLTFYILEVTSGFLTLLPLRKNTACSTIIAAVKTKEI